MKKIIFAVFTFMLPIFALQASLLGTYNVKGYDPILYEHYTGTLVITIEDGIYCGEWSFNDGGGAAKGVGLLKCNQLSFVFIGSGIKTTGLQVFQVKGDTLKGPWINFEVYQIGHETAKKVKS